MPTKKPVSSDFRSWWTGFLYPIQHFKTNKTIRFRYQYSDFERCRVQPAQLPSVVWWRQMSCFEMYVNLHEAQCGYHG